jgi:hypothetical protein
MPGRTARVCLAVTPGPVWADIAKPPYRPVPGTAVYHLCVDGSIMQVGEYDLEGPLRDLVIVVPAVGSKMLPAPGGRPR